MVACAAASHCQRYPLHICRTPALFRVATLRTANDPFPKSERAIGPDIEETDRWIGKSGGYKRTMIGRDERGVIGRLSFFLCQIIRVSFHSTFANIFDSFGRFSTLPNCSFLSSSLCETFSDLTLIIQFEFKIDWDLSEWRQKARILLKPWEPSETAIFSTQNVDNLGSLKS
jgi:hypothetical protein